MLKVTAPNKAGINPCTQNPSKERRPKRKETKISIKALIIKLNNPKLIRLAIGLCSILDRQNYSIYQSFENKPVKVEVVKI